MNINEIKERLNNLRGDLLVGKIEDNDIAALADAYKTGDKSEVIETFIKNSLYCCTSNLKTVYKTDVDMNEVLINFSMGIDEYKDKIIKDSQEIIDRYYDALKLLILILKLPMPYSLILYLRYYKGKNVVSIIESMEVSRSYYYAYHNSGINKLCVMYNRYYSNITKESM